MMFLTITGVNYILICGAILALLYILTDDNY